MNTPESNHTSRTIDDSAIEKNESLSEKEQYALLLDRYLGVEAQLAKELEYGRLVRGKVNRLKSEIAERRSARNKAEELLRKQKIRIESLEKKAINLQNQVESVRGTLSFRLGFALIHGFKSWSGFLKLPGTLIEIRRDSRARRQDAKQEISAVSKAAIGTGDSEDQLSEFQSQTTPARARQVDAKRIEPRPNSLQDNPSIQTSASDRQELLGASTAVGDNFMRPDQKVVFFDDSKMAENTAVQSQRPSDLASLVSNLKELRIACIMDEFTYHSFKSECNLFQLKPESWKAQILESKPDILFLESAWKGADEAWAKKVSDASSEVFELIDYCKNSEIPVVFWNKEDPFHFGRFLPIAKRVNIVFTTDVDCIEKYKYEVGHDNVYLLPFAAQPTSHNPIEHFERKDAFSFAGSFYLRYPERQRDFDNIYDVGQELKSVDIYDRNFDNPHPHLKFPEKYDASIVGCLPVEEIDKAYKGYKFGINMNTIKYSQTMFARRVFELMASNTIVVSNFSRGLRTLFGDLVVSSDAKSELFQRLKELCEDDVYYRKFRLAGLRKVLGEHTYSHRLAFVISKITDQKLSLPQPNIAMVGFADDTNSLDILVSNYGRQTYASKKLYIVVSKGVSYSGVDDSIVILSDPKLLVPAIKNGLTEYVAPLSENDYYGPNYLTDLTLAKSYGQFAVVGKAAHYICAREGAISLAKDGAQYKSADSLCARSSLFNVAAFEAMNLQSKADINNGTIKGSFFSIDEFNYCMGMESLDPSRISTIVDDIDIDNTGLDLENTVYRIVDTIAPSSRAASVDSAEKLPGISAKELHSYLPKKIANTLKFSLIDSKLAVKSTLAADQHKYIYLTKLFTRAELNFEANNRFQLLCDGDVVGDARTIYVFLDDKGEKIEHAMNKVGAAYSITIPKNCKAIKLGFRFQGPGESRFERLILGDLREKPSVLLSNSKNLVLTKQYPDYSDLYKYGFLHSRIKEYKKQNLDFEVFRVSEHVNIEYREFEGIDILSSDYQFLDNLLRQGTVTKIIVHFIDHKIWNVLKKYAGKINIFIWVHGADIQPWYRRAVRFDNAGALQKAKLASDVSQEMWLDIFGHLGDKLHLVFVSEYLVNEVQNDFGCQFEKSDYTVIHNYVDNAFFAYSEKKPEARAKILSVRPYASAIYGNDLSVEAVQMLSHEPFFNELTFKFVGDGPLFDSTLAPIRDFANVSVHKGFITQSDIASLHKDYGLFLVPSRMDTQGVSRDEAMSSGLVPITTRIAAIPEFVDESCAVLAPPENAKTLADGIKRLFLEPDLFLNMSKLASEKVRAISGFDKTIKREIELIESGSTASFDEDNTISKTYRVAIYGDVNLNLTDGSAIWAVSLAETLAGIENVYVTLFLKSRIKNIHIISPLLNLSSKVRLVEPKLPENKVLTPREALEAIEREDSYNGYDSVILRGMDLCNTSTEFAFLKNKLWTYITDLPQQREQFSKPQFEVMDRIFNYSHRVLCQTKQFKMYVEELFPQSIGKTAILSPMIPNREGSVISGAKSKSDGAAEPLRLVYAGKFAPMWGIRELFDVFSALRTQGKNVELQIFGDKIHNPQDDASFKPEVINHLTNDVGVVWHKAVSRDTLLSALPAMHIGWAYRHQELEANTRELSTKILEYASMGVPVILSRNEINEQVFGKEYPLFVESLDEAIHLISYYSEDKKRLERIASQVLSVSETFTFEAVRRNLLDQKLISAVFE